MGSYYFLACLLPPLPTILGEKLRLPFFELSQTVRRYIRPEDNALLTAHLSVIDAGNWENHEQGLDIFMEGGILSREEMESRRNLPDFINEFLDEKERGIRRPYIYDRLWELYYEALLAQAKKKKCHYLMNYLPWEIELRNRLGALRLRKSGWNAKEHAVLPGLGIFDFVPLLSRLEGQKNPLAAERYLDGERLKQIYHCEGNDPFSLDIILAFLSRAIIYCRWERLQVPYDMNDFLYGGG